MHEGECVVIWTLVHKLTDLTDYLGFIYLGSLLRTIGVTITSRKSAVSAFSFLLTTLRALPLPQVRTQTNISDYLGFIYLGSLLLTILVSITSCLSVARGSPSSLLPPLPAFITISLLRHRVGFLGDSGASPLPPRLSLIK